MSRHAPVEIPKERYDAVIFDLDGIQTRTAKVHTDAWKELFDEYRGASGGAWKPFDPGWTTCATWTASRATTVKEAFWSPAESSCRAATRKSRPG